MLRESSIAEDYWKQVIDEIKQQDATMFGEKYHQINSSSFESSDFDSKDDEYGNYIYSSI